ncbi:MAG: hypothetical protein HY044_00180 [Candidatus Woesebacteria bacterium]|nr:MAG: hypothetical protein HY044_00180 [Candidatus Woesebacteria bacterium]
MGIFGHGSKKDPKKEQVVSDIDGIFRDLDPGPVSAGGPHRTTSRSMSNPPRIVRPVAQPLSAAHDPFAEPTRSMSDEEVMDKVADEIARRLSGQMAEALSVTVQTDGKQQNILITDFVAQMRQQLDRLERKQRGLITFKWWEIVLGSVFFGLSFGGAIVFILAIAMR